MATSETQLEGGEPKRKSKNGMVRVQFDFSEDALKVLDALLKDLNVKTRAEVIRRALEVFIEIREAKGKKAKVYIEEEDGTRTRILGL